MSLIQELVFTRRMVKLECLKVKKVTLGVLGSCNQKGKEAI